MSLDFFRKDCQYTSISAESFGLCDKQDGTKAYPDIPNPNNWIAQIKNETRLNIVFTAIDKCVLTDQEERGKGRCDGMLTTQTHLYLVELKDQLPPWQSDAIRQLESTIQLLNENHDINGYRKRKAFACNKKREKFVVIDNETNKSFFARTGFRIDIQAEIVVV